VVGYSREDCWTLFKKKEHDIGSLNTIVLDEADDMLSMGFIEDIEEILSAGPLIVRQPLFRYPYRRKSSAWQRNTCILAVCRYSTRHLTVDAIDTVLPGNQKDMLGGSDKTF
jgi:hypothetical protein